MRLVNGVATFPGIIFDTAGTYTLTASDGALGTVTSTPITISPQTSATTLAFQNLPTTATAGQAPTPGITVAVEDALGNVVTGDSSTVTLTVASGPGNFAGSSTLSVAAVNGIATFSNLLLDTAGTYTFSASDGTLTGATSGSMTVDPGAPAQLVFQDLDPTVAVEDESGNVVTNDNSTVTLSVNSGPGSFTSTSTTSAPVVNGVATFTNLNVNAAGTYTLAASDNESGVASGTSRNLVVTPTIAANVVFQNEPTNGVAGQAVSPFVTVAVEDFNEDVVTSDTSTVTLTIASGPGTFASGSTTSVAAVNGVATFSNLVFTVAGNYVLTASDGALGTASSSSFTIVPAQASQLVVEQAPPVVQPARV